MPPVKPSPQAAAAAAAAAAAKTAKARPVDQTFEEIRYLKQLIDQKIPVGVKMTDNQVVRGQIEYYDHSFIRLTRTNEPNLFIFKHDIKYVFEDKK